MAYTCHELLVDLEVRGADFEREARLWSWQMKCENSELRRQCWQRQREMSDMLLLRQKQSEIAELIADARETIAASKILIVMADLILARK
jgi:hypothetical protein